MYKAMRVSGQSVVHRTIQLFQLALLVPLLHIGLYCQVVGAERMRVRHELSNRMYSPGAYLAVRQLVQLALALGGQLLSSLWLYMWGHLSWASWAYAFAFMTLLAWYCLAAATVFGWCLGPSHGQHAYSLGCLVSYSELPRIEVSTPARRASANPPAHARLCTPSGRGITHALASSLAV